MQNGLIAFLIALALLAMGLAHNGQPKLNVTVVEKTSYGRGF